MRQVQNAALFGLWTGTAFLLFGITSGSMLISLVGVALGLLVGVPAAYMALGMKGNWLNKSALIRKVRMLDVAQQWQGAAEAPAKASQKAEPRSAAAPVEIIPKRVGEPSVPPASARLRLDEPIAIPVRVERAMPPAVMAAPLEAPAVSQEDRQHAIDDIESAEDVADISTFASHRDALVRLYAIQRLGNLGDQRAAETLQTALEDDQDIVKRAARIALNKLNLPTENS